MCPFVYKAFATQFPSLNPAAHRADTWKGIRHAHSSGILEARCQDRLLKIFSNSQRHFRLTQAYLTTSNFSLDTYALLEERKAKVFVEGVPSDTPCYPIRAELATLGFAATSVSPLQTARKQPVNSFLIKLRKAAHFKDINDLNLLMHLRVHVKSFDPCPGPHSALNARGSGITLSIVTRPALRAMFWTPSWMSQAAQ